jgi:UDPglucose--hexose-1-phosphate uridylyltransferase
MPELRRDPVVGRWVIMATERSRRPSDFVRSREERKGGPCAFCPGMEHLTPPEVLSYRAPRYGCKPARMESTWRPQQVSCIAY